MEQYINHRPPHSSTKHAKPHSQLLPHPSARRALPIRSLGISMPLCIFPAMLMSIRYACSARISSRHLTCIAVFMRCTTETSSFLRAYSYIWRCKLLLACGNTPYLAPHPHRYHWTTTSSIFVYTCRRRACACPYGHYI